MTRVQFSRHGPPREAAPALIAIHRVLIAARALAYREEPHALIAAVLDTSEYLPTLMLEEADRTDTFRAQLVDLAHRCECCTGLPEMFDRPG